MPVKNCAYAAHNSTDPLVPWQYEIRDCRDDDVLIEVMYCGICHSDIHTVRSEWFVTPYPLVPGHEFTGVVVETGAKVTKFKVKDRVAVGCMVGSCRQCTSCNNNLENYCTKMIQTYGHTYEDGSHTYGGYGRFVVVPEHFVVSVPDSLPMDRAAPLLCAGITTYSPLVHNGLDKGGKTVGVVGLGGLGHMAVQFAAAFGNNVYVITHSHHKKELAMSLGAKGVIHSSNANEMAEYENKLDFILDTVSVIKPLEPYIRLLKRDATYTFVGLPDTSDHLALNPMSLIMKRITVQGSCIGGMKETQDMLNFCGETNVLPLIELIPADKVNEAYDRVVKSDVKFRFVIDVNKTNPPISHE